MGKPYDIVVAGQACLDITPRFKDPEKPIQEIFRPGGGMRLNGIVFSGGGAVCNTGLALHKLGVRTLLWGLIGVDAFGTELSALIKKEGASAHLKTYAGETTAYTLVIVQPGQDRIFLHDPGVDDAWTADDMDYGVLEKTRMFHFGYPTAMARMYANGGGELTALMKRAYKTGVMTSLDMSIPHHGAEKEDWSAILSRTLPYVDFFCPSVEEALALLDPARFAAALEEAHGSGRAAAGCIGAATVAELGARFCDMGAKAVLIKCSVQGMYLHTGKSCGTLLSGEWENRRIWQPALQAGEAVSTSGAGDTAIAGFLGAVLKGFGPAEALRCAAMAGALAVRSLKNQEFLPESVEALHALRAQAMALPAELAKLGFVKKTDSAHLYFDKPSG
ncbi:MAG: carbohydrate kinase family protein [Bacillota bacterium]